MSGFNREISHPLEIGKSRTETLKKTISISGELELLQMISDLDTENVGPPREDEL